MKVKDSEGESYLVKVEVDGCAEHFCTKASFRKFLKECGPAQNAIKASIKTPRGTEIIGIFRYGLSYVGPDDSRTCVVEAAGTWVDPEFRRQGVATQMWDFLFECLQPSPAGVTNQRVQAMAITKAGNGLLKSLVRQHGPAMFGAVQ